MTIIVIRKGCKMDSDTYVVKMTVGSTFYSKLSPKFVGPVRLMLSKQVGGASPCYSIANTIHNSWECSKITLINGTEAEVTRWVDAVIDGLDAPEPIPTVHGATHILRSGFRDLSEWRNVLYGCYKAYVGIVGRRRSYWRLADKHDAVVRRGLKFCLRGEDTEQIDAILADKDRWGEIKMVHILRLMITAGIRRPTCSIRSPEQVGEYFAHIAGIFDDKIVPMLDELYDVNA